MPDTHNFEHLRLLRRYLGPAKLRGFGEPSPQTLANRNARQAHSDQLRNSAQSLSNDWKTRRDQRQADNLPVLPKDVPILLKVDTSLDLDLLRARFTFEIVAEQEEGYVIVASE